LQFFTNDTLALTIDSSRNLGLGVTPSAWASGFTAMQVRNASFWSTGNDASITANAYYDGSNYRFIGNAGASRVYHNTDGSIGWSQVASGTAGNAISFTQAMTLTSGGNLLVGTTTDAGFKLDVNGTGRFSSSVTATGNAATTPAFIANNPSGAGGTAQHYVDFTAGATVIGRILRGNGASGLVANGLNIDNFDGCQIRLNQLGGSGGSFNVLGGNVGIGTTSPQVAGGGYTGLHINGNGASLVLSTSGANLTYLYTLGTGGVDFAIENSGAQIFRAGSNERMRITSGGNVLIGTTSDNGAKFQVNGSSTFAGTLNARSLLIGEDRLYLPGNRLISDWFSSSLTAGYSTSSNYAWVNGAGNLVLGTDGTERMRITSVGFTKASNTGSYWGVSGAFHENVSNSTGSYINVFNHSGSDPYGTFIFFTGASPNNTTNIFLRCADSTTNRLIVYSNGNVLNTNGSYGSFSDIKLKENIKDATPKLDDLLKVKVRNYNLIGEDTKQIGVIAQELEEIFPGLIDLSIDKDKDGNDLGTTTKSVKYSVFVPMLIKAIQEQQKQIEELKNKLS